MKKLSVVCILLLSIETMYSQEISGAFANLKEQSVVGESESVMRKVASESAVEQLLAENPSARYFCFTEDRAYDVRLSDAIPARWTERAKESRTQFAGTSSPGEFYTWQIAVYAPFVALEDVRITFSDLKGDAGGKIPASAIRCFNLGGVRPGGQSFVKRVDVPQGGVQAFWIGMDVDANCRGTYRGKATVAPRGLPVTTITVVLNVAGQVLANHGDDEAFRKTRLRWLDASIVEENRPTSPYIPMTHRRQTIEYLGGTVELATSGLPRRITTRYDRGLLLSDTVENRVLNDEMTFVIETEQGLESFPAGKLQITSATPTTVQWKSVRQNRHFEIVCTGRMEFDGFSEYRISVKAKNDVVVKDIRLETPYSEEASGYLMGLGNKGGKMPALPLEWKWDVKNKHQDKLWIGNVNAGLNMKWKDENYVRPLVNVYYGFGSLKEPVSWGNSGKGGVFVSPDTRGQGVRVKAYSGRRNMKKGETLYYCLETLVTPVKPFELNHLAQERFYHSGGNTSGFISAAKEAGANYITIHHASDIYPFINYPYSDETVANLKRFVQEAHRQHLKVRVYYTTRELTVKIPEIWALRSLGDEVIFDGPGKDARTVINSDGPKEWLVKNLSTHFIPAWYHEFKEGDLKGDLDISIITTPDSRWNNYYLNGLDWMVKNIGIDGFYIDDSALDRETLRRGRRMLDADGNRRLIDMHSWNHFNQHAGYANSLHIYLDLLPYIDRTWIGEGFVDNNTLDFWLVEMSGIPFGLTGEMLDARNIFRGMIFGMLPRLPWNNRNSIPMWKLWDEFGMKDARMLGYWDTRSPVKTSNDNLPATVYINGDKALVVIANWTDIPQNGEWAVDEKLLGFTPSKVYLPEIEQIQWGNPFNSRRKIEVLGRGGLIIMLEK